MNSDKSPSILANANVMRVRWSVVASKIIVRILTSKLKTVVIVVCFCLLIEPSAGHPKIIARKPKNRHGTVICRICMAGA